MKTFYDYTIPLLFIHDVPAYRNLSTLCVYGPYETGQVKNIPRPEAEFLISQGWAREEKREEIAETPLFQLEDGVDA